jgi:hypothetical protein
MSEDRINMDGTVDMVVDCHIQMPLWDYKIMLALELMNNKEKEHLLHHAIPKITKNRVTPRADEQFEYRQRNGLLCKIDIYSKK